jgi:hypothetical protein
MVIWIQGAGIGFHIMEVATLAQFYIPITMYPHGSLRTGKDMVDMEAPVEAPGEDTVEGTVEGIVAAEGTAEGTLGDIMEATIQVLTPVVVEDMVIAVADMAAMEEAEEEAEEMAVVDGSMTSENYLNRLSFLKLRFFRVL